MLMDESRLGTVEARFADILWQNTPIGSGELVKLCEKELGWKKSTTYTMLRRLCQRGLFENRDSVVPTVLTREEFYARQSEEYVRESFRGSLPAFLAAFGSRSKLTEQEIDELQRLIDEMRG